MTTTLILPSEAERIQRNRDVQEKIRALLRAYVAERTDDATKDLLRMAWWDLWYGPFRQEDFEAETGKPLSTPWPGFEEACRQINEGLQVVPRTLFVDLDADLVFEQLPEGVWMHDPDDPNADEDGDVWVEPFLDHPYECDWRTIKKAVGSELAEYLE